MNNKYLAALLTLGLGLAVVVPLAVTKAQTKKSSVTTIALDSLAGLEAVNGSAEVVSYNGRRALHLSPSPNHQPADDAVLAIVSATDFRNGTIEVEVAGKPRKDAPADARGFIGVVFRTQDHGARGEDFYLRPTNGRADDQLRATTPCNMSRCRIFRGTACARKIPACTSLTRICRRDHGPN